MGHLPLPTRIVSLHGQLLGFRVTAGLFEDKTERGEISLAFCEGTVLTVTNIILNSKLDLDINSYSHLKNMFGN